MSAESLYQAVKSGRVKLDDLNDSGKEALRSYMNEKQPSLMFQATTGIAPNVNVSTSPVMKQVTAPYNPHTMKTPAVDVTKTPVMKSASQYTATHPLPVEQPKNELPGRHLPVIGPILRGVDWVADNPISNAVAEYSQPDAPFLGQPGTNVRQQFLKDSGIKPATGAAKFAGQMIAPFMVPGAELGTGNAVETTVKNALQGQALSRVSKALLTGGAAGAYAGAGSEFAQGSGDPSKALQQAGSGALFGGALYGLGEVGSQALSKFMSRTKAPVESRVTELLGLPRPGETYMSPEEIAFNQKLARSKEIFDQKLARSQNPEVIPSGPTVHAQGELAPPLGLPAGNYIKPQRLKVESDPNKLLSNSLEKIKPEVEAIITPPSRRDLLIDYIQTHLSVPKEEVWNMPTKDLQDLGQMIRKGINVHDVAVQVAGKHGYDLASLLDGKAPSLKSKIASDAQKRVYGVFPEATSIKQPEGFNVSVTGQAAGPREAGFALNKQRPVVTASRGVQANVTRPALGMIDVSPQQIARSREASRTSTTAGVHGTIQSLKDSPKTAPELISKLGERTDGTYTVKHNEQTVNNANKVLDKKGTEDAKSYLLNKRGVLKDDDMALAYRLIDDLSRSGDFDSAADVVLKLTKSNLEGGRSIQVNAIYNRLTPEGALRVATKVYNSGIESIAEHRAIPAKVAEQISSATVKMQEASGNKALAQDVVGILDKANRGETLNDAEISQLKKFSQEAKKFIPATPARSRDKVVEFTSRAADEARKRLAAQRNVGFAAKIDNPVLDYAIIGVDYMVKGAVKFSDFAENMAKESASKLNLDKVYIESWKRYQRLNKMKATDFEKLVNQAISTRGIDGKESDTLRRMAIELSQLGGEAHKEALGELQQAFNTLKTSSRGEKAASLLRTSQLGNLRTIGRNEISNQLFYALDTLRRKFIATPIDLVASKVSGKSREVFFKNNPASWTQYFTDWKDQYKAWQKGINLGGLETQYDLGTLAFNPNSSRTLERAASFLERQVGAFMKASDYAAANRAINTEMYQLARSKAYAEGFRGKDLAKKAEDYFYQADEAMAEQARSYGEYMTFQDKNFLSDAAMKVKDTLNFGKDFGLGNIFFNYPKTPANIFMRAIDYSPMGYLRFMAQVTSAVFKKGATKKEIIDSFSRATAGTAMGAMGYWLASMGLLNVMQSKDKNMNSLERSAGIIPNSLNVDGLIRYAKTFDPEQAKPRQGDHFASVDWLQPMAITASSGAAIAQSQSPSRMDRGVNAADATLQALDSAVESATNMSVYKNIKDLVGNSYDSVSDKVGKQLGNAATAFVPSLSGQLRNTLDSNVRDTKSGNMAVQVWNNLINKIPGASKTLPKRYDTLGKEMKSDYGVTGRAINSFINPSLMDKYQPSEGAQAVLDLINRTGEVKAAPNAPSKTFTYKKQTYAFTPSEYRDFQQKVGGLVDSGISKNLQYLKDPRVSDENKLKRMDKIMSDSMDQAKLEYRKLKGIR